MGTDQEPAPLNEQPNLPPFLSEKELQMIRDSFVYSNFNIASPPGQEPYLVITTPEAAQPLIDRAFTKAREKALNEMKKPGADLTQANLPEEEEKAARGQLSEIYLPAFQLMDQLYFYSTLTTILLSAELGAQVNALRELPDLSKEPDKQVALYNSIARKQALIRRYSNGEHDRYLFYCGDKLIYKTPGELENPYSPSSTEKQN